MRKRKIVLLLLSGALLLSGCAAQKEAAPAPSSAPPAQETPEAQGPAAEGVRALMAPYEAVLARAAAQSPGNLTYAIPGDMLRQMALDAQAAGAAAENGRYAFTWREAGSYTYTASADDAFEQMGMDSQDILSDPSGDAPMDSQLNGDYAVAGGGAFERTRAYDAAESLAQGTAEISDAVNGQITGHEVFSFALRDGRLYFADATLDLAPAADADGLEIRAGYLAAVGVLSPEGLETVEYRLSDLSQLPDPSSMDFSALAAAVTPVSRLSVQGDTVTVFP